MDVVVTIPLFISILNFWAVAFSLSVLSVFSLSVSVATLDVEYMSVERALHKEGSALLSEFCPPILVEAHPWVAVNVANIKGRDSMQGRLSLFLSMDFFLV